jgi:hypothetical protein
MVYLQDNGVGYYHLLGATLPESDSSSSMGDDP